MADADYTDAEEASPTDTFITDRIKILTLTSEHERVVIGYNTTLWVTAELEQDNHALGSGDSLTISGITLTWDPVDSRFEGFVTQSTPQTVTYDTFTSGNEATYGITEGNMNSQTVSVVWYAEEEGGGGGGGGGPSPEPEPPYVPPIIPISAAFSDEAIHIPTLKPIAGLLSEKFKITFFLV